MTRKLVDVAQDVIIRDRDLRHDERDLGAGDLRGRGRSGQVDERLVGRFACDDIYNRQPERIVAKSNEEIDEIKARKIDAAGVEKIKIRSC